ncbi:MAG TPA: polyprenol phosphomannose-dependent alpha 1,6 mannosyltransferase MptB, partial [Acidimicrobiales bacterium]|nr:polyprenol phosphomannose-dependent alpha 1,6 mannosyltransferase MptB [Acidimicrobiales bacterium]
MVEGVATERTSVPTVTTAPVALRWPGPLGWLGRLLGGSPTSQRPPLLATGVLGTLATLLIAAGASQPSSPFATKLYHAWFFGIGGPLTNLEGGMVPGLLAVFVGMTLLVGVWYRLSQSLRRHPGFPVSRVVPVFVAWTLPVLVGPPLFSQDIYAYAALGAMVGHGLNPYHVGIQHLGASHYVSLVYPQWLGSKSPYGPLFLALCGVVAGLTGYHPLATVVGLRVVVVVATGLLAACLVGLAREYRRDPAEIFALAILNPVTVLGLVGAGHNDPIMLFLLAGGLLLAKRGRPALGIVACALAAAVKFPAGLGILFIGWGWLGRDARWQDRIRPLITAVLIGVGVMEVLARVTGLGWGWLANTGTPGEVHTLLDPATALGVMGSALARLLGLGGHAHAMLGLTRGLGDALAVVVCLTLLWWSPRLGRVKALGLSLLAVVVLGPVIQPWYFSWALLLLVPVATGRFRQVVITLSMFAAFVPLDNGGLLFS